MSRAGFVLVGGGSSRMGRDKALLPYRGDALAGYVARAVAQAAGSATLVGEPARYAALPWPRLSDLRPGEGPLAGVEAALAHTSADWNLVVACDMPHLTAGFLAELLERAERSQAPCLAPISAGGRWEPLCAVWRRDALPAVSDALARGIRKMQEILEILGAAGWRAPGRDWAANCNTPAEFHALSPHE